MVDPADLHDIDTMGAGRRYLNKLPAHIGTGPMKLMGFKRSQYKDLNPLPSHSQSHKLHGKGFSRPAGAQNCYIGVLIDRAVKNIRNDKRAVVFIYTQQNAIIIAHFIAGKGIAACRALCQQVAFTLFIQLFFHSCQG